MSRYADRLPRTYARAEAMLGNRESRTLFNNTSLHRGGNRRVNVVHHNSVIAAFEADGSLMLTNAGYGSKSTRERLNAMSPAHVSFVQRDYSQQVLVRQGDDTFSRVIESGTVWIDRDGHVTA